VSARRQRGGTRTVQLRAVGYSSLVADYPLTFPPPLAEHSANSGSFDSSWHLIQYVFNLPDPRAFPPFAAVPSGKPLQILRRYSAAARELAESAFLAHPTSLTVHVLDGGSGERIDPSFAPKENIRGFSVLFRQFYSDKESASFHAARRVLGQLNVEAGDDFVIARNEYLRTWRHAASKLRGFPLKILVGRQLQAQGRWHPGELVGERDPGPEMLISIYNYGEDIHWGDKRDEVAAWNESPFDSAWMRMACFDAMVPLAHIYLGFAQIVDAALADRKATATASS
jgi:hypothetical protein